MYKTILIDPPWAEHGGGKCKRGADRHYPLMSARDIERTIRTCPKFIPDRSCHLFMWVTNNFLREGLAIMSQLEFRYVNNICWVKMVETTVRRVYPVPMCELATDYLQKGLGQYQRGSHELLLFGVRMGGESMVPATEDRLPSVVFAERGQHSAKPVEFYERLERMSPGPYFEMFARNERPGWDSWGNEV